LGENVVALRGFRKPTAALFAGLLLVTSGCDERRDHVREALERIRKAAEARDVAGVLENLAREYRDNSGAGAGELSEALRRYFAGYEIINLKMRDLSIERATEAARARFRVDFSGQPRKIGGLGGLLPTASTYDFDVRLVPDERRWKVAWASWEPTPRP
jgi:hypothetical protein